MNTPETIPFDRQGACPKCPQCESTITSILKYKHGSHVEHHILVCPECMKIIGYSAVCNT